MFYDMAPGGRCSLFGAVTQRLAFWSLTACAVFSLEQSCTCAVSSRNSSPMDDVIIGSLAGVVSVDSVSTWLASFSSVSEDISIGTCFSTCIFLSFVHNYMFKFASTYCVVAIVIV